MFESDVTTFLADLPPAFRLELDHDWSEPINPVPSSPPSSVLTAQKGELAILANRVIMKLYLPFLKDSHTGAGKHQAILATLNAAHAIIYASRMLHGVWANTRPAAFDFYDFGRALFDAAVVCAHAVIQQPSGIFAGEALKGIACALDVLRTLDSEESSRAEAVRVVEMMKRKAEASRTNGAYNGATAGVKRKRDVLDDERMEAGFQFPYVGPSVSSVKADPGRSPGKVNGGMVKDASLAQPEGSGRKEKKHMKEKEKDKGKQQPVGIRARPTQPASGGGRPRGASVSSNAAGPAVHSLPPPRHTATPASGPSSASSSSASHIQSLPSHLAPAAPHPHDGYAIRPPQTPVQQTPMQDHMPREDYPMQFSNDDVDRRRYESTFSDSPQGASLFDTSSLSQPSPVSYTTGPTPPNYYQYAPPPGPPQSSQGPPTGYENPPMNHPQSVAPPMGSLPMDTSGGQPGLSMSTMVETRYGMSYRPEHAPPMSAHDYHPHPPPPQGMPMPGSHAWLPPEHGAGAEMWNEYKYVG
ncbi:uncharacterized protein B0H18DRAFT_388035 [Fomitopsis serialis]|uniref:uncharacterized protein n=1 Tax=Fomitopsis serialis TaxID=139415 RepID=UPI0020082EE4|nr:uncharacterized protein B0H18DRAFT_388035 [Neoantrodia serialis]KAH9925107.1 hypothetical protein B0H18DRAFT_388035 [Neoantrodia serialis]